jgi:hypothetical protein
MDNAQIRVYNSSTLPIHYSMRVIAFALWINGNFHNNDQIQIFVDGTNQGSSTYMWNFTSTDVCDGTGN